MSTPRHPIGWFEIYVNDMDRAKTFYEHTFQVTLERIPSPEVEMWAFPNVMNGNLPGCPGALAKMEGKDAGVGGTIIYFVSEDCAVEAARAVDKGGKVLENKMPIGEYGFIVLLHDSEGNLIGVHSMK